MWSKDYLKNDLFGPKNRRQVPAQLARRKMDKRTKRRAAQRMTCHSFMGLASKPA